jgi:hypothetical protein
MKGFFNIKVIRLLFSEPVLVVNFEFGFPQVDNIDVASIFSCSTKRDVVYPDNNWV